MEPRGTFVLLALAVNINCLNMHSAHFLPITFELLLIEILSHLLVPATREVDMLKRFWYLESIAVGGLIVNFQNTHYLL